MQLTINSAGRMEDINWSESNAEISPFPDFSKTSARTASGNFGRFMFHRLKGKGYTISHINCSPVKDVYVTLQSSNTFLGLQLQYKSNMVLTLKGIGKINLRERHFHLSYLPEIFGTTILEKDTKYATFNVHFSAYLLNDLSEVFPGLQELLINAKEQKACMLRNSLFYSSSDMRMIVTHIVKSKFSGEVKKILTDLKVTELLILVMDQLNQNEKYTDFLLSESDRQNIHKVAELIAANIKTPKTIRELARDCGINENKLKKGFKKLYKRTVFEYVTELRMEKAHHFLIDSKTSVTDIAFETGYKNVSNFSTAFKRYYGFSPAFLRK